VRKARRLTSLAPLLALAALTQPLAGASPAARRPTPAPAPVPLIAGLGSYHRPITARSPAAQRYFDQGLRLLYAFNLEEAERSFAEAARLDPTCASCSWGVGMALGPHINLPAQADRTRAAFRAAAEARRRAAASGASGAGATPVERALIAALGRRYADPPPVLPEAQAALDRAYADAMRDVHRRFPADPDAGALFAEAMMDLRPWDLWTHDGRPQPGTAELVAVLEDVLRRHPEHPGANHYYIHAVEASPRPERALASARRIGDAMPAAGHLVHMPGNVYMRVGRYEEAAEANRRAIRAEAAYVARAHPRGFYLMYVAHNYQFLWAAALMEGRSAEAFQAARDALAQIPAEMMATMPGLDFALGYPQWTAIRFARYAEVLRAPQPPAQFPYARAMWHVARGLARVGKGKVPDAVDAAAEHAAAEGLLRNVPAAAMEGFNSARALGGIAADLLGGEIAAASGRTAEAIALLRRAAAAEDGLAYDEPSDWNLPVRHALGAVLLAAGRPAEAEAVYREDLRRNPENGWALKGLEISLRRQRRAPEAAAVERRFARAWRRADVAAEAVWPLAPAGPQTRSSGG